LIRRAHNHIASLVVSAFFACFAVPAANASQSNDQGLVPSIAAALNNAKVKRVVVFDLIGPGDRLNQLDQDISDGLSQELKKSAEKFTVIDRSTLREATQKNLLTPEIVQLPEMTWWLARELRVDAFVIGKLSISGNQLEINVGLVKVRDGKQFDGFTLAVSLTEDMQKRLQISLSEDYPARVAEVGANVSSLPACLYCPRPDYSDAARDHKFQGTVDLLVLIDEDGLPKKIVVTHPLEYRLTEKAIEAVQKWKFNPAKDPDGRPVAVWTPIEVTFRLY
jgi:TonB family protein